MNKHTAGPWTLTHKRGSNFAVQTFEIRGMLGGSPNVSPIFNKDTSAIDGGVIHCSPEDARLIAAAPDLLEALEELRSAVIDLDQEEEGSVNLCEAAIRKARLAIAKARGEA
jgi:hypothetical protein